MAQYLFEGFDPTLRERLVDGTILVVGANFGIGSSREHVPLAMKGSGIRGVVGRSFARIFYRNCVNLGLAIVACPAAADAAHDGSRIAIDTAGAVEVDGVAFDAPAAPPLVLEVGAAGGLVDWTASRIDRRPARAEGDVLGRRGGASVLELYLEGRARSRLVRRALRPRRDLPAAPRARPVGARAARRRPASSGQRQDRLGGRPGAVDQVYIGNCANGTMTDLRQAASILGGRRVHPRTRAIVVPATQAIWREAAAEGLLDQFVEAGAIVSTPTCGACFGGSNGILAPGENAVTTTNRNFRGRMGSPEAGVYLANAWVAAAAAVAGELVHPETIT